MKMFYGFCLASVTGAFGHLAWILTMTSNPLNLGGWLPWAMLTFAPILFFGVGMLSQSAENEDDPWEHVVLETE